MVKNISGTHIITGINIVSNVKIPNPKYYNKGTLKSRFLTCIVENCINITKSKNLSTIALVTFLNEDFPVSWGLLAQL